VSPNMKMLLFIIISMVVRTNSVGKDGSVDSLCVRRSFESAPRPVVLSMFVYIEDASVVNNFAPGGSSKISSC